MAVHPPSVTFVTGASRGIGRLIVTALAADGSTVAGFARSAEDLDSLRSTDHAGHVVTYPLDVATHRSSKRLRSSHRGGWGPNAPRDVCRRHKRYARASCLGGPRSMVAGNHGRSEGHDALRSSRPANNACRCCRKDRHRLRKPRRRRAGERLCIFASAKAGVARFTETLATELSGTGVTAVCIHPGFVYTPMTEHLASSEAGRQWLPEFGRRARDHWGDGASAVALIKMLNDGEGDGLSGRIVHVGDDLEALTSQCGDDSDLHRLRVRGV